MSVAYADFIERKNRRDPETGFEPGELSPMLYPFQRDLTEWSLRRGRAAIFADCGLGKTPMQLEWAQRVCERTVDPVLIVAPLAVSSQTVREGVKFGIEVTPCREASDVRTGVNITNYERLERFMDLDWAGIVLDESSILKSFDGKTREALIQWGWRYPFRLCCTATPSPNDYMELGGHSAFLGVLSHKQMLAEFFVNDGISAGSWRLKGHARHLYWRWVATWARALRAPHDLGYADDAFALPPIEVETISVDADSVTEDRLFSVPVATMQERRQARRESIPQRVEIAYEVVAKAWAKLVSCERQRKTGNTCVPTISPIQSDSDAALRSKPSTTALDENVTPTIRSTASASSDKPGSRLISDELPADDSSSASPQKPGMTCLDSKAGDALSAAPTGGSTSTTAMTPERSEGSSVLNATSGLESSRTPPSASGVRADISMQPDPAAWVIWCDLNDEQRALERAFGDKAISIYGTLTADEKEDRMLAWLRGDRPVLISKPTICAWGINMQRCSNVLFVGLSDSYEQYYQAVRRCWRFGQTHAVRVVIVASNREQAVLENVRRKERQAMEMFEEIVEAMNG